METLEQILNIIEYPNKLDLSLKGENLVSIDFQGIKIYEMHSLDQNFIDYFQFRRREHTEYWNSLDIYIQLNKNDELLAILYKFLISKELTTLEKAITFNDIPNGEIFYQIELDDKNRIDIMRVRDLISIQIIKFD